MNAMNDIDIKKQVRNTLQIVKAVADVIRELKSIPSGHLYARLMEYHIDLSQYESIIGLLKRAELVKEENHLLIWIEP